jgi:hypothetical protein
MAANTNRLLRLLLVPCFAVAGTWFVAFNSKFVSDGAPLDGHEGLTLAAVCLGTAFLYLLLKRGWSQRPIQAVLTAAVLGLGLPFLAVATPVAFCLVFECKGFYFP